jgi:4-diphosphocytidyl-2-C-methyl-D-erythritol kinase
MPSLQTLAPAKVNLTLRVLARRADGTHELTSVVAFAALGDKLTLVPSHALDLAVRGPTAGAAGPAGDNLVLKAARAAAERVEGLRLGRFELEKHLPAGAGFGGGSADAAGALRLLADSNEMPADDPRLLDAAKATGADVAVCLDPKSRIMSGVGDVLSPPLKLPRLNAILLFPGVPVATANVFRLFEFPLGGRRDTPYSVRDIPKRREALIAWLGQEANDLSRAARTIAPVIAAAEAALDETEPELVRVSGSGSGVFAIYEDSEDAEEAAEGIRDEHPGWWAVATTLR